MSVKSDKVKSGYADLSTAEKEEVKRWIRDYDNAFPSTQRSLQEGVDRAFNKSLGPRDTNTCPCCGR